MAVERGRASSTRQSQLSHHTVVTSSSSGAPYQYRKPLGEKIKDCCRYTIAFIFSKVGVCVLMVGYTIMGASLFQYIEGTTEEEKEINVEVDEVRNRTIEQLWNLTLSYNVLDKVKWDVNASVIVQKYQQDIVGLLNEGWDGKDSKPVTKWTWHGAFLYSLTVITTIGYGHISPKTLAGKMVTILYTCFGMPVFLLFMANMGDVLARVLKWTYAKLCICRRQETKFDTSVVWRSAEATLRAPGGPSSFAHDPDRGGMYPPEMGGEEISIDTASWSAAQTEKTDIGNVNIPIKVSLFIMAALLFGGTLLFQHYEGWDYLTSLYFCFISLTTIGFGDYVPGTEANRGTDSDDNEADMSFIYCSLYLMFGLALLSMCFNLMQEEVVHKVTACLNAIRLFKRRETD